jgi:hypothetical protein
MLTRFDARHACACAFVLFVAACGRVGYGEHHGAGLGGSSGDAGVDDAMGGSMTNTGGHDSMGGAGSGSSGSGGRNPGTGGGGGSSPLGTGGGNARLDGGTDAAVDAALDAGCTRTAYYADRDGDGSGDPRDATSSCVALPNRVTNSADCDDSSPFVHPGAVEVCDGVDNDCDLGIDETGCPPDATGSMWNGTPYLLLRTGRTWGDARAACTAANLRIVEIETQAEQDHVWSLAGGQTTWIGGTDDATEGEWLWASGKKFWTGGFPGSAVAGVYSDWLAGTEPQNSAPGENCATLFAPHQGKWADEPCATRSYPAICEGVPAP